MPVPGKQTLVDHSGFFLGAPTSQQLLYFSDGLAGIQSFRTGPGAVHDRVTTVHRERISHTI